MPQGHALRKSDGQMESQMLRMDIDEDSSVPVQQQLVEALNQNAVRVIDVYRCQDDDQSGNVDKKEFRKAMQQLGFEKHVTEIDALFDSFDPDGSGTVSYHELNKLLRRGGGEQQAPPPRPVVRETKEERAERMTMTLEAAETQAALDRYDSRLDAMHRASPTMKDSSWGYSVPLTGGAYAAFTTGKPKQPPSTLKAPPMRESLPRAEPGCSAPPQASTHTKQQRAPKGEAQVMSFDIDDSSGVP